MPKQKRRVQKGRPTLLILAGIVLLLIGVFTLKHGNDSSASAAALESQLDHWRKFPVEWLPLLVCVACGSHELHLDPNHIERQIEAPVRGLKDILQITFAKEH